MAANNEVQRLGIGALAIVSRGTGSGGGGGGVSGGTGSGGGGGGGVGNGGIGRRGLAIGRRGLREDQIIGGPGGSSAGTSSARRLRGGGVQINLEYLSRQSDQLGYYMDDTVRMMIEMDRRAHDRYMTPYGQPLPPTYTETLARPRDWNTRMGYPHDDAEE